MPESFPRLENPENNLDKEALKQKIAANFDDIKKTVYDMDQEKKNAGVHSMANKQLSTESMEYVMDPMQLKKERGKRSTKKKKHQFALEETPEQAIQKAFDQQQQKELAVEGDSKQTTKTNKQVEQIEQKYEQKITQEQTTLEQQVTKCAEIKETNPSDYQEVKGWFLLHAEMTTDALLGTQVMGKRCKQLTTTLLASQIAVIEEKEVTQEKLTADQIVEKFIAAKKSYELKKDKESEQNLLDERLEQNSPFEKEFTKKQKKELFDIHISSDFADIASPATPRQIVDRKEIFGTSDDSIDKIVNSTDAGRLYQRVAKNNPAAITRITAAHRYVKPNAVYEEVVRHDVIAYAMTMYKYFLQEIYLQIWKETGYEETPSQPTDRSNPYVLIQETQTNLEKDASLYTSYITDLQDYCNKENITQSQINEATNGIQSFVNALNKTFQGKLPKEYMDKKYGTHLDTAKLFEHLRLYQAYQSKLGEYIKEHTEEIKKANDTIAEFTTRIQTEKSATPTPEEVTDEQCRVDEYLKAVGTQDTFWKEENKIRKAKGSVVIDDMEKYAVAEKVQEVTQQIGSENLNKRSSITGELSKQRTDRLDKNKFTRNGRPAETALTSYARYITRLSNHPDFVRASKNYEALTKVFDAQTKDLSSSSQILFPATRENMQKQKLQQAEVDQFYASLKNHTPALYGIANLGSQFISGVGNAIRGAGAEIGSFLASPFVSDANLASHQDLIDRFKSWVTIPSSSAMKTPLVNESGKTNFTVDNILSQTGSAAGYTTALLAMAGTKGSRLKNVRVSGARLQPWLYTSAPLVETGMELTIGGYFTQARQQGLSKADAYRYSLIQLGTNSLLELISPNRLANIGPMKFNTQLLQGKSRNVLIRYFLEEIVEENAQEVTQQITEDQFNTYFNAYKQTSFQDSMTRGDVQSLVLITSLSTGLVQTHGALQIYETLTATQALYQKHLQMLDDLMKKGSLPQGVKIENIEEVQKMLENTRAKKLSALSAKELKTLLAGTNDKFHDYGRAREVLLPDDPKLSLQILLQGHPKIRKLLSEITNDFSPDACKKIRTDVEQSISSLFDHPIYGPLVNLMLYLDETLAKDESIDDDSGTITVSQTSIQVRTLLAELLLPELKNHTFPGYSTLQELIADAHDEPTNAQTARILFGAGLINSQVTTLMRLGICGKVRADDISGKLSTQPLLINGVEGIVKVGASSLVVTIEGKPITAFPSSQGRIDCAKAIRKGDTIVFSLKDKKGNPIEIAPSIQELLLTYISNQNEFSEFRNDDCYAFLAKATEGDQPGGWYDLMQRNAEGSLDTDEIETFKEIAIPVDEREINEIPIGSILLFETKINGKQGYSHSAVYLGQGIYLSKLGKDNNNLVVTNLEDLKKLYRSTTSYSNISYILPGNIPTTTLELPKRAEEFKAEPDIATILDQSPPPDHRFQKRSPDATLGGSGFIIKSLNKEINYEQWKEPKIYHIENTDVTSYNYYAYNTSSNAKTLIDRWSDAFNNALTGVLPGMKEGKAYERIRDNIHDKRVATQDPDYMYFATYNKYKDIQELFAKRAKQQPSLGQEAIEQIQTAMTAFIKEFGYLRGYKSSDIYGGSAIENFIYKKSAQAELFDKLYTVFTQIDATVNKDIKVWMREGLCAQPPIQMLQPIVETYCTGVKEFIDLYNAAEDKGKFMQEGKEKGMYHQFCYDPDAIYEQVSTISGMEGKFKIASNTLLTDELLALYAQAYTILKPYFLESKKASFESTEGPKILEAYMQQHSSSEKTAIESPKSLFSSKILDGNYVFSSCPAEAKIIKYENNTLTYTLGGKEFTMTDESQLRKGILYKKDLVANLFANGVDARHRVQVEENLSVELLHMPSVDAFFLWLEDNIEGKNGYRLSRTQCKIIFDTLNTYEAEKKLFAYPEAEKTFQEVQDTKVKERFEKGITKQETRELLTAYPYLEMYVPYLGVDFELMGTGMYGFVVDCGNNRVAKILRKGTSHDIFKDEYEEYKSIYNRFRRCDNSTFRDVYVPEAEGKINFDGMSYIKYEKVDGNSVLMTYAKQHYKQSIQDKIISPGIYTQAQIDEMSDFKLRNMLSLYLGLDETQLVKAGDEAVSQLKNKYKPYDNHPRKAIALLEVTMGAETAQQVYNFLETLDKDMHKRHPDLHGDNIMIDKDGHIAIIDRGH